MLALWTTLQDWELGNTWAPEYVLRLIAYKVHMEKVSKGIYISPDTWKDGLITKHFVRLLLMQRFIIIGRPEMNHLGEFVPVNEKLSEIFLQLHISEKSGRGVPTIIDTYGKDAITFRENSIVVTIPFNRLNEVGKKVGKKVGKTKGGYWRITNEI